MKELQQFLQQFIGAPININYGYIQSGYQTIIVVQNEKLVEIGQFLYTLRASWNHPNYRPSFELLAKRAELYRLGNLTQPPQLYWYANYCTCVDGIVNTSFTLGQHLEITDEFGTFTGVFKNVDNWERESDVYALIIKLDGANQNDPYDVYYLFKQLDGSYLDARNKPVTIKKI